jgi:aspartyl-tRNA(Asn)/glutamyl-tRNA(Gln) amidotransferase subunit C
MSLTRQDVGHIAALAHLELADEEIELFRDQLSSVLEYVGQLGEVETRGVEPTAHVTGVVNVLREDAVADCPSDVRAALLAAFPDREGDLLKVKAVFKDADV